MADITVRRTHGMELDEAKGKVRDIVSDLEKDADYIDKVKWNSEGTAADVKGKAFSGKFQVDDEEVVVDIDLKLLAKPFKGKIEQKVAERMDNYFS